MIVNDLPYAIDGDLLFLWNEVQRIFNRKITLVKEPGGNPGVLIENLVPVICYPSPEEFHPWILGHELMHLIFIGQGFPQLHISSNDIEVITRNIDQPFDHAGIMPALAKMKISGHPDPIKQHAAMHAEQISALYPQLLDNLHKQPSLFNIVTLACYVFDVIQFASLDSISYQLRDQLSKDSLNVLTWSNLLSEQLQNWT